MSSRVSVVVTTYNQAPYIEEALRSVFDQSYAPFEVVVVDDGSTDDTPLRIASFGDRVVYLRQNNQGVAASRNAGIRRARGALLAFLDGDDLWEPEKLAIQIAAAQKYPESGLIVTDGVQFSDIGILLPSLFGRSTKDFPGQPEEPFISARLYDYLLQRSFVSTTSQVMIPAAVFQALGLSDTRFTLCSDYDLYLRIASRYDVTLIKKPLARWRYLASSASGPAHLRNLRWLAEMIEILKKQQQEAPIEYTPVLRQHVKKRLFTIAQEAYYYGRFVDRAWATRYLFKLMARNFTSPSVPVFLVALWFPQLLTKTFGPSVRRIITSEPLGRRGPWT